MAIIYSALPLVCAAMLAVLVWRIRVLVTLARPSNVGLIAFPPWVPSR